MADRVLVTGATGYIARACIRDLLQRGFAVRATVRELAKSGAVQKAVQLPDEPAPDLEFVVADLTADKGWTEAAAGCRYVLHVASPLGMTGQLSADQLIETARGGTLRVLGAALDAGVERIVLTSAANASSPTSYAEPGVTDETLWTDPNAPGLIPYRRSKTLAELAAWECVTTRGERSRLATVLPGAVFGPVLSRENLNSVQIIGRLLRGEMAGVPNIGLEIVDVRDLADLHIRAMTSPAAAGERFLGTGEFIWLGEVADILKTALGPQAAKVPTRRVPDWVLRVMARFRPELREVTGSLGRRNRHSIEKARTVLGWAPRPAAETVVDCARSLINWGIA